MPRKSVPLFLIALLSAPLPVYALGLGEISLDSALNEPLVASISLDAVQPGDLTNFRAAVASGETFSRYGLDRPEFLNNLRFEISVDSGSPELLVRSSTPITEPFLTFLVEANWDSGRLLREYTVLLDPPVFNPGSAAPPLRVPNTANTQLSSNSGFVPRREPTPAPRAPRPAVAAITGNTYGPVRRNQTLWAIAERAREGSDLTINQMMIAIYRANPDAFLGNINLLKEGSTLTLPGASSVAQISRQDAFTAARDHNQRWRAGGTVARTPSTPAAAASSASDGRRLKLVAPEGTDRTAGLSALQQQLEEEQNRNTELNDEIEQLRSELAESERLFNLRNSDLADMQARLAAEQGEDAAVDVTKTEFEPVPTDTPDASDSTEEAADPLAADLTADEATDTTPTDPVSEPTPEPVTQPVAKTPAPIQSAPSLMDRILGLWPFLLGALALLGGLLFWRSRRAADPAQDTETWEALSRDSSIPTTEVPAIQPAAHMEVTEGPATDEDVEYFEDTGTFKPIDFSEAEADVGLERQADNASAPTPAVDFPFEDTLAGEDSLKLDQSDPLAEADFHIAYGLYDQAADLVRAASEREPERRDLKMKLLEIFFVWGNKDAFLASAQALHNDIGDSADRDWDKVVIMGRQICPGDSLFSGDAVAASSDMVDLQLDETGETPIDLDTDSSGMDDPMDFDLSEALDASADATGTVDNVIDFDFSGATAASDDASETIREKLEAAGDGGEDTEEIDLSDLGVDLDFKDSTAIDEDLTGATQVMDGGATGEAEVLDIDIGEDFDELFGGLDDLSADLSDDGAAAEAPQSPDMSDVADAENEERDKLLDTSELKVEMEELLASAAGMQDEPETADDAIDEAFSPADETGSFSAEIQSLANDGADIDIDFSLSDEDDDDATELMEGISIDDTQAGNPSAEFSEDVFGSDDETVLSPALSERRDDMEAADKGTIDESFGDDEFGEIFADDSDSGTSVLNVSDQDFSGDNDATVLAQSPIGASEDDSDGTRQMDEATFQGVFDDDDSDDDDSLDLGDDFSASVFGDDAVSSDDSTQESMAIDLDVGDALFDDSGSESGDNTTVKVAAKELALPDLDEGGSSEVGTKLDLARAYMEMGDPDGARGILQEVINEGDDGQKQDARALLDALP